ncbi:MAG: hypothetical protein ACKVHP_10520 [Verrucomicrobiales bacterium]
MNQILPIPGAVAEVLSENGCPIYQTDLLVDTDITFDGLTER